MPFLLGAACAPPAPMPAGRVVCISPGTEANLFALGLGGEIGGVSDFCPVAEAAGLPRVGGQADPNLERIASLVPVLVLVQGRQPRVEEWCAREGVEFRAFATDTLAGWRDEMRWLGARFGQEAEAERLLRESDAALAALRAEGSPRRALLVVSRRAGEASGILAAGPGTFLSELLAAAGGINVLPRGAADYPEVNEESLIRLDPDAIVEFGEFDGARGPGALAAWSRAFPGLAAVRAGRVRTVLHPESLIPGPRMHEVAAAIHASLR